MSVYDKKYQYTICKDNSPTEFKAACKKIEDNYPMLKKEQLAVDVDGSTVQIYTHGNEEAIVYDDYDIGAVFILSDIAMDDIYERAG